MDEPQEKKREAIYSELVHEYSPSITDTNPSQYDFNGNRLKLRFFTEKSITEVMNKIENQENPAYSGNASIPVGDGQASWCWDSPARNMFEECCAKLWRELVVKHFSFEYFLSTNRGQSFLVELQQRLTRYFKCRNPSDVHDAILDVVFYVLIDRRRQYGPGQLSCFKDEKAWRHYFYVSSFNRFRRKMKSEKRFSQLSDELLFYTTCGMESIESYEVDIEVAKNKIKNLPSRFTSGEKKMLLSLFESSEKANDSVSSNSFGEKGMDKVIRKAIRYLNR